MWSLVEEQYVMYDSEERESYDFEGLEDILLDAVKLNTVVTRVCLYKHR